MKLFSGNIQPSVRVLSLALLLLTGIPFAGNGQDRAGLEAELKATETAFAGTMADRDLAAFRSFLAGETVFFSGEKVLRGRQAVSDAWAGYFEGPEARFSWEPEAVTVLESGQLGMTSGPIFNPKGERIGTFNSVWRRTALGGWEIVFDRGCPPCGSR